MRALRRRSVALLRAVLLAAILVSPALRAAADRGAASRSSDTAPSSAGAVRRPDGDVAAALPQVDADLVELDTTRDLAAELELQELDLGGEVDPTPASLPTSHARTTGGAVSPQSLSLPTAEGSLRGFGESFAIASQTGSAGMAIPISVAPGRAGVQPSFSLAYSATNGDGPVGLGWSIGVPFIGRMTDRGLPRYVDHPSWHVEEDRFFYNGGQELVPVANDAASIADCGATTCAPIPAELAGWQQYRARVEGAFMRFFRSPDSRRWVVQGTDGSRLDFGVLPAGDGPSDAVAASAAAVWSERPGGEGAIHRWALVRSSDSHGSVVWYRWTEHQGDRYLLDVHYTSPHAECSGGSAADRRRCAAPLWQYASRVGFVYDDRPDPSDSYASGWRITTARRLVRIEITSARETVGSRFLVRRYHFRYASDRFHSMLESVLLEGRPSTIDPELGVAVGDPGVPEGALGAAVIGDTLPPVRFSYTTQPVTGGPVAGFGGLGTIVRRAASSPPRALDDPRVDLLDVNSDGLPDVLVTDPARFRTADGSPAFGVYFNGFEGEHTAPAARAGTFSAAVPIGVPSAASSVLSFANRSLLPMDADGDGRTDLVYMPTSRDLAHFVLARNGDASATRPAQQGFRWVRVRPTLPAGFRDPRIDLEVDRERIRTMDVNGDHLVDVVRTSGSSLEIWLALGWLPGGEARFGSWSVGADGAISLSSQPLVRCLPHDGVPVDFADPEIAIADLNGDGVLDIARTSPGRVVYWPGRGDRGFGTGAESCTSGFLGASHVTIEGAPRFAELADPVRAELADVNGDGTADLVQVRFDAIDVWFNRHGRSFTARATVRGAPPVADPSMVRLLDVDGSGTTDVVYGNAGDWRWIDLMDGVRPRVLVRVDGALGGRSEIRYGTSTEDYLRDLAEADACTGDGCERFTWSPVGEGCDQRLGAALAADGVHDTCVHRSAGSPVVLMVARETRVDDRMSAIGLPSDVRVTRYRYHDAYYEGIEHEVRGFAATDVVSVGGPGQPTLVSSASFHQGRRPDAIASDRLADNPFEALRGIEHASRACDEAGVCASSSHSTIRVRRVMTGLNGIAVSHAYARRSDRVAYDVASWAPGSTVIELPSVELETDGDTEVQPPHAVRVLGARWAHIMSTIDEIDRVGHTLRATAHGRVRGEDEEPLPDETIVSHAEWENLPGTESGWLWRAVEGWTTGHGDTTPLGHSTTVYGAEGDARSARADVHQPMSMRFDGDGSALGYGAPSPDDIVSSVQRDAWGHPIGMCDGADLHAGEACVRWSERELDAAYAHIPVRESIATARTGTGYELLSTNATIDRGLGLATTLVDANAEPSAVRIDGLGRLTATIPPPALGCAPGRPGTRVTYVVSRDPEALPVSRIDSSTELACTGALGSHVTRTHTYADGLGRVRATLSTGEDDADHRWVRASAARLGPRGAVVETFQPAWYAGSLDDHAAILSLPSTASATAELDAFGRSIRTCDEIGACTEVRHHALSSDACDPHDLDPSSPHYGTCATSRVDGHGRAIDAVQRNRRADGTLEHHRLFVDHRADGAVLRVVRAQTDSAAPWALTSIVEGRAVERLLHFDTLGRRYAITDPDTDSRAADRTAADRSWRYLFNRVGDLVAVRDPRGCGQNFFYDLAGRLIGEQYVGCDEAQAHEDPIEDVPAGTWSLGELSTPVMVDVRHVYDSYADSWAPDPTALGDHPDDAGGVAGRLVATVDRAARVVVGYDRRGATVWTARRAALMPGAESILETSSADRPALDTTDGVTEGSSVAYDEAHTYVVVTASDHAGRSRALILPRDPDFDGGPAPRVIGRMQFDARGLPRAASMSLAAGGAGLSIVDGELVVPGATESVQPILEAATYDVDGAPLTASMPHGIEQSREYDIRRLPIRAWTLRAPTASASLERPLGAVSVVADQRFSWDAARNLTAVDDARDPTEWAPGLRPQSYTIAHDSLYRVISAELEYTQDDGTRSPVDSGTDWRAAMESLRELDPMRTEPAPMVGSAPSTRVASLVWEHDWLGSVTEWNDDAHAFYERSLGTLTNGSSSAAGLGSDPELRPSALYLASDLEGPPLARGGWVEVDYGEGGNVVALTAHGSCTDASGETCSDPGTGALDARRAALRTACVCADEQHYDYRWDELNRLSEARRWDRASGGAWSLVVRQRYRYDGANVRVIKETRAVDASGLGPPDRIALSIVPGDFERRGLVRAADVYEPDPTLGTETQYLLAGARIVWQSGAPPTTGVDRRHRITLAIGDLLGSTSAVVDLVSGDLLEASTFYPNGARETFATSGDAPAEPIGFTAHEEDEEVGLTYFGERYLISRLGRWASPDPLHVHAMRGGEALNSYHYVSGGYLQARDPIGLSATTLAASSAANETCGPNQCKPFTGSFRDETSGTGASASSTGASRGIFDALSEGAGVVGDFFDDLGDRLEVDLPGRSMGDHWDDLTDSGRSVMDRLGAGMDLITSLAPGSPTMIAEAAEGVLNVPHHLAEMYGGFGHAQSDYYGGRFGGGLRHQIGAGGHAIAGALGIATLFGGGGAASKLGGAATRAEQALGGAAAIGRRYSRSRGYQVLFEVELPEHLWKYTRPWHNQHGNHAVWDLIQEMSPRQLNALRKQAPGLLGWFHGQPNPLNNPGRLYTWHHVPRDLAGGRYGIMELVFSADHESAVLRRLFHPNNAGGYADMAPFRSP